MTTSSSLSCALAWIDAVNQRNVERAIELSDPEIEIVGPRGIARGHQILQAWMAGTRLELETLRTFHREDIVVLWQHGIWQNTTTGEVIGEQDVASHFRAALGRITFYARHDTLSNALAAAGLEESDERR